MCISTCVTQDHGFLCKTCNTITNEWYYRGNGRRLKPCKPCYAIVGRAAKLRNTYRISLETFNEMLERQDGVCAICKSSEPDGKGTWHVDHDRSCCSFKGSCGKCVRGLLCTRCNAALGFFKDDTNVMYRAIQYVEKARDEKLSQVLAA